MTNKLTKQKGFTIVEVMIVLAIAGIIMLVVFLAVPALQRSSRNNQRNSDASKVAAAVEECLSNHNGVVTSCDTTAEVALDTTSLTVLTTYDFGVAAYTNNNARVVLGSHCSQDGSAAVAGTSREVAVTFQVETGTGNSNRCISG